MTDKNRFIAEKLEPGVGPCQEVGRASPGGMYVYKGTERPDEFGMWGEWVPLEFHTDPAAMVALIEAIMPKGFMFSVLAQDNHYTVLFSHENDKDGGIDSDSSLMLAVRDAAYKALGGE